MSNIAIQGAATGTGVFTLASPATNTNRTLTLPDEAGTVLTTASSLTAGNLTGSVPTSAMPAGSVLQVVSVNKTNSFSTSSSSDQDTSLGASITPSSASSKILIIATTMLRAAGGQCFVYQKLWRGAVSSGTLLHNGYPIVGSLSNSDVRGVGAIQYLDSPATTSSVTYRISINSAYATTVYISATTSPSTITLMEIAG